MIILVFENSSFFPPQKTVFISIFQSLNLWSPTTPAILTPAARTPNRLKWWEASVAAPVYRK